MSNGIERRGFARYGVRSTAHFTWKDREGSVRQGQGLTRDINSKGMFIYSQAQPTVRSDIEVEVSFSSVSEAIKLRMKAWGVVVRWEPDSGMYYGFAVLNSHYTLETDVTP